MAEELFWRLTLPAHTPLLEPQRPILGLGSCFVDEVLQALKEQGAPLTINPTGTLYNPLAIAALLQRVLDQQLFTVQDTFEADGQWRSFHCHSRLNQRSSEALVARLNEALHTITAALDAGAVLLLTFGTALYWQHKESATIAANCQRVPGNQFDRRLAEPTELVERYRTLLDQLTARFPRVSIIGTVSPVRYEKGDPQLNSVSKGRLQELLYQLQSHSPILYSFPAYEILTDELRDYRFYADDLRHPSTRAVRIITERFLATFASDAYRSFLAALRPIVKALSHRTAQQPIAPVRREALIEELTQLEEQYKISLSSLIKQLESLHF